MQIRELTLGEFEKFSENHPYNNFHQSLNYALLKSEDGYEYEIIGYVDNDNNIHAACLVLVQLINKTYLIAYIPEGILIDYTNRELLINFTKDLYKFYKKEGIAFIRINPSIPIAEINLKTYQKKYNDNEKTIDNLKEAGFIKLKDTYNFESILPRFDAIIDLDNFNIMGTSKNTRNKIKKAMRKGLKIEKANNKNMNILYEFIKNKKNRDLFHYNDYYNIYSKQDEIDYYLISIDPKDLIINSQVAYENELNKNELLNSKLTNIPSEKNINRKMNSDRALTAYKDDISQANIFITQKDKIYIAGALVIKFGNKITILFSGYDKKYKDFAPNYYLYYQILMQYKGIYKYASLCGISGDFSKNSKFYGLNKFKLGFNPKIYEYIGEFDLVLNKINYHFLNKKDLINQEFKKSN